MLGNKKRTILFFVSLIGIIVTSLILVTSYAYQTLNVEYEQGSDDDVTINVGKLDVSYISNKKIELSNMPFLPNYKAADYTEFTIDNSESTGDVVFNVTLTNLDYSNSLVNEVFKYNIVKVEQNGRLTDLVSGDFRNLSSNEFLLSNSEIIIEKGKSQEYRLYLWLDSGVESTTDLSKAYFTGLIKIDSVFASDLRFLNSTIMGDSRINKNEGTLIVTTTADYKIPGDAGSGEIGMYSMEDDYGTSWYFRGAQSYNYVNFAGFIWRIVRINGDGSIRLILQEPIDQLKKDGVFVFSNPNLYNLSKNGKPFFNTNYDNGFVGYTYGSFESMTERINFSFDYDSAHENIVDSKIKKYIDVFYKEYLLDYGDYIADTIFCGDKSRRRYYISDQHGYSYNNTYYGPYERIFDSGGVPVLRCAPAETISDVNLTDRQLSYSRYTVGQNYITNGTRRIMVNNSLTYPIALISADEVALAGGFKDLPNKSFYLYNPSVTSFWTMSPYAYYDDAYSIVSSPGEGKSIRNVHTYDFHQVRPVINLKSSVKIEGGDGTSTYTYDENGEILTGPYTIR